MTSILKSENGVTVQTVTESYTASRLVLTAGSWAAALLAIQGLHIPLEVMPMQLGFFQATPAEEIVGKILADLALEGKTEYDTSLFKLSRFQQ